MVFYFLNSFISFLNLCSMIVSLYFGLFKIILRLIQVVCLCCILLVLVVFVCSDFFLGCVCLSQVVFFRLSLIQNVCGGSRSFKILWFFCWRGAILSLLLVARSTFQIELGCSGSLWGSFQIVVKVSGCLQECQKMFHVVFVR